MADSRTISKFICRNEEGNWYDAILFLDHLTPNNFSPLNGGKVETTVYGEFAYIKIVLDRIMAGKHKIVNVSIHPDRLDLITNKILNGSVGMFKKTYETTRVLPNEELDNGYCKVSKLKIYYDENTSIWTFTVQEGKGLPSKDKLNRLDCTDFVPINTLSINMDEMECEQIMLKVQNFLRDYHNSNSYFMFQSRSEYEKKCKTIFKDCRGNVSKIIEVEKQIEKIKE